MTAVLKHTLGLGRKEVLRVREEVVARDGPGTWVGIGEGAAGSFFSADGQVSGSIFSCSLWICVEGGSPGIQSQDQKTGGYNSNELVHGRR